MPIIIEEGYMKNISLSYVLTTRNKLPYLTHTLKRLINNVQADEEIIVVDGESTDGTVLFLDNLFKQKKIQQFISEPDHGESHGINKGILLANGKLIKLISDDDYFNYSAIQDCKIFLLENKEIDVMGGNIYNTSFEDFDKIARQKSSEEQYKKWLLKGGYFTFTGSGLMIRKSSLALTGLFNCSSKYPDTEYSLRITSMGVRIAWNTDIIAIRIENERSNLRTFGEKNRKIEADRCLYFYDPSYRKSHIRIRNMIVGFTKNILRRIIRVITLKYKMGGSRYKSIKGKADAVHGDSNNIDLVFKKCEAYISKFSEKSSII